MHQSHIALLHMQLAGFAMLGILQFDFDNHGAADLGVIIAFGVMVSFVVSLYKTATEDHPTCEH